MRPIEVILHLEVNEERVSWREFKRLVEEAVTLSSGVRLVDMSVHGEPDFLILDNPDKPRHPME